ncbi:acyltransferase family protein [Terriglobus aquaticus]|uniref:Acyltransferase family protein n=1 Tax=Terriglobus aquaticus TaxID=940139 RepID=A0ABW9KGB3_9BACT|nr:acyltransferase [Terriglobus aquaticus]
MHLSRLDGLRALAILAVMLHHFEIVRGGWVGVDLFFVLSGYLITTGLRKDRRNERFWSRFYLKRVTRILPAAMVAILVAVVAYRPPLKHVLLYVVFLGNLASASSRLAVGHLLNFWSLAVEEHFYFVFPFAVRHMARRALMMLLLAILVLEPVLRVIATSPSHRYTFIYFLTPFRLDGLACGALLAVAMEHAAAAKFLGRFAGLCAVGCAAVFAALSWAMPGRFDREANTHLFNGVGYSLLAAWFVFTLAYVLVRGDSPLSRALTWRPLAFIGTISYGLYLYHQFIHFAIGNATGLSSPRCFLLAFPAAVAVSWVSFYFFERPITEYGRTLAGNRHPAVSAV